MTKIVKNNTSKYLWSLFGKNIHRCRAAAQIYTDKTVL